MTASLSILGEVRFDLDGEAGATGSTSGYVRGEGDRVIVHAEDPVSLINATIGAEPGWIVPFLAQQLHDGGLTVDLTGPRGTVATIGAGVNSPLGRLVGGTRRLRLVDPVALLPIAAARLRPAVAPVAAGALAVVGLLVWRARTDR